MHKLVSGFHAVIGENAMQNKTQSTLRVCCYSLRTLTSLDISSARCLVLFAAATFFLCFSFIELKCENSLRALLAQQFSRCNGVHIAWYLAILTMYAIAIKMIQFQCVYAPM